MRNAVVLLVLTGVFVGAVPAMAGDEGLERILRAQVFNKEFEGFDFYWIDIAEDRPQADGSREVLVVAGGKFLNNHKQLKVLVLIAGGHVGGGQILERNGLPPCKPSSAEEKSL